MTGIKLFARVAVMALIFAACGGSDTTASTDVVVTSVAPTTTVPPTTTTTVPPTTTTTLSEEELAAIQYDEDVKAIKTLWRRFSDSWLAGSANGYQYITDHNHPLEECTGEDWKAWKGITDEEHSVEAIVDESTIERDDGWPMPSGPNVGTVPEGRIYIFSMSFTEYVENFDPNEATLEVHSLIDASGTTYFFFGCT